MAAASPAGRSRLHRAADHLSFCVVAKERLTLPARRAGAAWHWRNDGSRWPRHRHDELELNIGLRGSITYLVEDRLVTVERDGLLALFPAQEHAVVDRSPGSE